jgi:hypothetical protein
MPTPRVLDDLLFTLAICRQQLPQGTHPIHLARLQIIERIIRQAVDREPREWAAILARSEQVVDQALEQRR